MVVVTVTVETVLVERVLVVVAACDVKLGTDADDRLAPMTLPFWFGAPIPLLG